MKLCRFVGTTMLMLGFPVTVSVHAQLPQQGDLVFGLGQGTPPSLELVRGPATLDGGMMVPSIWNVDPFIQSVKFDNLNRLPHNAQGNLVGVNFGPSPCGGACGGNILNFSTTDETVDAGQLIGDTIGLGGTLTETRLAGLSISPNNDKIALMGYDAGSIVVYDYNPGDTKGAGALLSGGRETALLTLTSTDTQAPTWLDNNTVLAMSTFGPLLEINATTMAATQVANIATPLVGSDNTYLTYEPSISPYLYANYSGFDGMATTNKLYILDPANSYNLVKELDLSMSANTLREMALDSSGNLFMASFGSAIDFLEDVVTDPAALVDNSSVDWYTSELFASFSSIDIALNGEVPPPDCDFNDDDLCNGTDVNLLTADIAAGLNTPAFDLNDDDVVNTLDLNVWLTEAGELNLGPGKAYLLGDATLDGVVDVSDFNSWNMSKFTNNTNWTDGNFDASSVVDVSDFNIWNGNKFQASDGVSVVPEPSALLLLLGAAAMMVSQRRGRS